MISSFGTRWELSVMAVPTFRYNLFGDFTTNAKHSTSAITNIKLGSNSATYWFVSLQAKSKLSNLAAQSLSNSKK